MTTTVTAADVIREGAIKVVLPWGERVGEISTAGLTRGGHQRFRLHGELPKSGQAAVFDTFTRWGGWEDSFQTYDIFSAPSIVRAPEEAEAGDPV